MFKIALSNPKIFTRLSYHSVLSHFFVFRTDCFPKLINPTYAARIYALFRVTGGTSKQTASGRFYDLDGLSAKLMSTNKQFIHDVAVSSGITSVEFYNHLKNENLEFKMYVSDKFSKYWMRGGMVRRIYDHEKILLHAYFLWIYADKKVSWKYPISKLLFSLIQRLDFGKGLYFQLPLYDFRLMELIGKGKVSDINYDILSTSSPNTFTFVRCMNVLNISYFHPHQILKSVRLLNDSLVENGILLIGKTNSDGNNSASYYKKNHLNQLMLLEEVNGGTEIKQIVNSLFNS